MVQSKKRVTLLEDDLDFQELISRDEILREIAAVGRRLEADYDGEELVIVMVMKGAICVVADLIRAINTKFSLEFVQCQSYFGKERGALTVKGLEGLDVQGRHVLVVDDIFDSGVTIATVIDQLKHLEPKSLKSLVLVRKRVPPKTDYVPDYVLFEIENRFIVGYGLDYNEHYRGLPGIYAID